jgi:hypothetical protein
LIAAAAILAVVGGVVLVVASGDSNDDTASSAQGPADNKSAEVGPASTNKSPAGPSKKTAPAGTPWTNPLFGYTITLPPGYRAENITNPALVSFVGSHQGTPSWIVVSTDTGDPAMMTPARIDQLSTQLVAKLGGVVVDKRRRTVQGKQRLSIIYDLPRNSTRWSFVVYVHGDKVIVVMHGTSSAVFPSAAGERFELYEKRIQLPRL